MRNLEILLTGGPRSNMSKVQFIRRRDAFNYIDDGMFLRPDCDWDMVSISDSTKEKKEIKAAWMAAHNNKVAAHFVNFLDVDDPHSGFTESKAEGIVRFLTETNRKKKNLLVHCFLGVSRSGAVAKFAYEYFGFECPHIEAYGLYNKYVFNQLREVAGFGYGYTHDE